MDGGECLAAFIQPIMKSKTAMKLLWASDIHLDRAGGEWKERFFERLAAPGHDGVVITGDIGRANSVVEHLGEIARATRKPIFFTLGNHDFFGGAIKSVESAVDAACCKFANLHHLGKGEIIQLGDSSALVGHRGWSNGGAGSRYRFSVPNPDRNAIEDFRGLSNNAYFSRVQNLGTESADYVRDILPAALGRYRRVVFLTHFPPHTDAVRFNGQPCGWNRMSHFANFAMGGALGIAKNYPERRITVLAGHSHCAATVRVAPGIEIKVAGARPGKPEVPGVIDVALL